MRICQTDLHQIFSRHACEDDQSDIHFAIKHGNLLHLRANSGDGHTEPSFSVIVVTMLL